MEQKKFKVSLSVDDEATVPLSVTRGSCLVKLLFWNLDNLPKDERQNSTTKV